MIILCSNGLTSPWLREAAGRCVKGGRAALVVTADPEYREKNRHVPRCREELEALGLAVEIFDLDRHPAQGLAQFDAVMLMGGNPYYLLDSEARRAAGPVPGSGPGPAGGVERGGAGFGPQPGACGPVQPRA